MNGPTFAAPPAARPAARPAPARPPARPDPDGGNGLRVLTYLQLHWLMILFCGTLLGGAGAYAAWELLPTKYESYALLQVDQTPFAMTAQTGPPQSRTDFPTYVKTIGTLIRSEFVLNKALDEVKDVPTIRAQKDPIKFLTEEVLVNADGSEVVRLSMFGHQPADVQRIINAVQKAFLKEVVEKDLQRKQAAKKEVEAAKQRLEALLVNKAPKPVAGGPPAPGGVAPASGTIAEPGRLLIDPKAAAEAPAPPPANTHDLMLKHDPKGLLGQLRQLADVVEHQLPLQIKAAEERLADDEARLKLLLAIDPARLSETTMIELGKDPVIQRQALIVARAEAEAQGSPADDGAQQRWRAQARSLAKMREDKGMAAEKAKRAPEIEKTLADREAARRQLRLLQAQFKDAGAEWAKLGRLLKDLPSLAESKASADGRPDRVGPFYEPGQTETAGQDSIFGGLVRNYWQLDLELNAPARVRDIQRASAPMQKDPKKQILATVAAGLFGYVLIALGAVGFEAAGKRVSSLADARSAGPAPVVAVIPHAPADKDPGKRAAANEALDKLRAYVTQTWLPRGASCVAVTSPLGDEGKAFAAFGLASSLAQAGYKTLLADFDLRQPAAHVPAATANEVGVCEVLRGELDAREAVVALPGGLDLLPAGQWTEETRKSAVGGRLDALLAVLKTPYDCVVIHTHSLLTAAEAVEVVRRCEAVLVCAKYRETTLPLLRKATDRVAAMEIPYAGVVYVGATEPEALC